MNTEVAYAKAVREADAARKALRAAEARYAKAEAAVKDAAKGGTK